ncbi:hypothetical protein U8335_03115 [Roseiconus lacunae]|uniref:Uncharacterized protein n=2 Tax=Roseiconus lacunae TaxID=2605694 RepID=A0ABT7PI08_9BACT|nr:hypothetical protein [Roseiconus lacunae]MCD0461305.1 hypothetical protein [Roseiconus lacunae]MDM4016132.1 hypothetical protein [Roseiconus lacunae]WRQ51534.1 hypothetical protein U8335_03115 [Stieleria sp. HD01]
MPTIEEANQDFIFPTYQRSRQMKKVLCNLLGISAVTLALVSIGCQPPKPPAPETPAGETEDAASDNTTSNTTAAAETPAVETPAAEPEADAE